MAAEIDDHEPVPKLTAKLRSEIMPPEPFEYTVLKPAEPIVETENKEESTDEEETFEETMGSVDTPKVQQLKPQPQKARRKSPARVQSEDKSVSQFHSELRKHSEARKKAEREILDIRKELKDLLLVHHATIKDLQKQVAQMHKKIATIDSSKKSARVKTTAKKITRVRKTSSSSEKLKKKSGQKKGRKR
jgi:hypothetical protein